MGESILRDRKILFESGPSSDGPVYRKGNGLIFPYREAEYSRQRIETRGRRYEPWGEFSFLFNSSNNHGIGSFGEMVLCLEERYLRVPPGAFISAHENPGDSIALAPGRTQNRIRSPR